MAFSVGTISDFTNETRMELIKKAVLTGDTIDLVTIVPGVKEGTTKIPYHENTVVIKEATCGWSPEGTLAITQRDITTGSFEVKDAICFKLLEKKFLGQSMKPGSPREVEADWGTLLAESYIEQVQRQIEMNLWQGDTGLTASGSYNFIDGLIEVLDTESGLGNTVDVATASGDVTIEKVIAMCLAVPENILDRNDLTLFMSYEQYRKWIQQLITANLYHHDASEGTAFSYMIPGTNIRAKATAGLSGSTFKVIMPTPNIVVTTDLMNEQEQFRIWYSDDNDEVRVHIAFKLGVEVFHPEYCVTNLE